MTGNEIRLADEVRRTDRAWPKAKVADRACPGFLGVVHKISLREQVCVFTDDLDGVFIGTHRAIGAEAEE